MKRRYLLCLSLAAVCCTTTVHTQWLQSADSLMSDIRSIVANGSYLYAGAYAGVYRSADNGFSWTSVLNNTDIRGMAVIGSNIFAGTFGSGVLRSTDNGANWTEVDSGLTNHNITCLLSNGSELFAGSNGAVQRSTDNGEYWSPSDGSITGVDINTMAFNGSNIFAGSSSSVYLSTNDGATWTPAGSGFNGSVGDLQSLGPDLFAATVVGIFRTTDHGQNWSPVDSGIAGLQATALTVSGSTLFAGTFGGGIYRSTNEGGIWTAVNTGLTYFNIDCLYSNGGYVYAGTGGSRASVWRRPQSEIATSVDRSYSDVPNSFGLEQNYPNPFNPTTTIRYSLPQKAYVNLIVYNSIGQKVSTLVQETQAPGYHEVKFDGTNLASGVYFYRIQTKSFIQTKKVLLLR
ncbi:MAG TPA: T9SS type A sorting domain-containing protein [Bacteroidota bacterium]|nr:T9SS type A sorting domain-containing protein [Bacteroidota bacterium]